MKTNSTTSSDMNLYKTNIVQKSQRVEHNMSPHEGRFFAPITSSSNGARDFSGRVPIQLHGTGGAEAYSVPYLRIADYYLAICPTDGTECPTAARACVYTTIETGLVGLGWGVRVENIHRPMPALSSVISRFEATI